MSKVLEISSANATLSSSHAKILVFIDGGVETPQFLADGIIAEATAFILDSAQNGIKQISEILQNYPPVESIHLVSHGSPGSIQLGNTYLSLDTMTEYQQDLKHWHAKSLLIYGCNVAVGDAGTELLSKLHQLTGANVAGSKTKTGSPDLGGDWNLEVQTNPNDVALAFRPSIIAQYSFTFIERVSISNNGTAGNYNSGGSSVSDDGRYVAFNSYASNLVTGDTNDSADIFVYDRDTNTIERISINSNGIQGNEESYQLSISGDGRYVAFNSYASNLVTGDTNDSADIFVYDRDTNTIERISVNSNGIQGNTSSFRPSISADGRYVAFQSAASNLVAGDTNDTYDIFVHDRDTNATEKVSNNIPDDASAEHPSISADGRYVAFDSDASNLVAGDTNDSTDIFVYDRDKNTTERISGNSNASTFSPSISGDGNYVAFSSYVGEGINEYVSVSVHDRNTNTTEKISNESLDYNYSGGTSISGDGRYVAFISGSSDAFIYDRNTKITKQLSVNSDGSQANSASYSPSISEDGHYVAFDSDASNLVAGDKAENSVPNSGGDVFVVENIIAVADSNAIDEDHVLTVAVPGVLSNDSGDNIAVTLSDTVSAQGAVVKVNSDGSYSYDPKTAKLIQALATGEVRDDTFNYTIQGRSGATDKAQVTIKLTGVNDAPVAKVINAPATSEDAANLYKIDLSELLSTSSDAESDFLTVSDITVTSSNSDRTIDTVKKEEVLSLDPSQFNDLAVGESETITVDYNISDGNGGITPNTATFIVEGRNDSPVVSAIADLTTNEDVPNPFTVGLLSTASDVDGDLLTVSDTIAFSSNSKRAVKTEVNPEGVLSLDPSQFNDLATGENETITVNYNISDGTATVPNAFTITVEGMNDAPVARAITNLTTNEDAANPFTINLLSTATDAESDFLTASDAVATSDNEDRTVQTQLNLAGQLSLNPNQFNDLASGEIETIIVDYQISDGTETIANTATITVEGRDDAPVAKAIADNNATNEDNILTVAAPGVLSNDTGDGIAVSVFDATSAKGAKVLVNPDGSYNYDPKKAKAIQSLGAGETLKDTFNYTIEDSSGNTSETGVTINLTGVNDVPRLVQKIPNVITRDGNVPFSLDISSYFSDVDSNDQLSFSTTGLLKNLVTLKGGMIVGNTVNGSYILTVTAKDLNKSATDQFKLTMYQELEGTANSEELMGNEKLNHIVGLAGDDTISGLDGSDRLVGNYGNDVLAGGKGNDVLTGGKGNDVLAGGGNADTFVLQSDLGLDTITDFNLSEDRLRLAAGFQGSLGLTERNGNTTINILGEEGETQIALLQGITDVSLEDLELSGS